MHVAIRVDASPEIGLGHLIRCLALGQALRRVGAEVVVVFRPLGVDVGFWCSQAGLESLSLSPPSAAASFDNGRPHGDWGRTHWDDDAAETVTAVSAQAPSWVIVDHYSWDARWHEKVRGALRCQVGVIDDLADRPLQADLIVDHNFDEDHRAKYRNRLVDNGSANCAIVLGGPTFALLGPKYNGGPRWLARDEVRSLGIFMGGADAADASSAALLACRQAGFLGSIEVVSTSANPHLESLQALVDATPATRLLVGLPDLADFFARHDLQIGAGGGATWERCCVGAPSIVVETAANQRAVIPALVARGVIASPDATEPLVAVIARLLADATARLRLSQNASTLVDGRGALRVALRLTADLLEVRPACMDDAVMMHNWRNAPSTRAVSSNGSAIPIEGHLQWLQRVLQDPNRLLFVGGVGTVDVGVIRFDLCADPSGGQEAEVSLFLDPALHGLGLGTHLLRAGERDVVRRRGETCFRAVVLDANGASRRMFSSQGYSFDGSCWRKRVSPISGSTSSHQELK
jgi:UDP-2,4-diacetamido-2,4,6-trideoxy-beta-L-altropyranose hydrolase